MHSNQSRPRYSKLARKAITYYLGDRIKPDQAVYAQTEWFFRQLIDGYVQFKVFHKQPYDWSFIDNTFRVYITGAELKDVGGDSKVLENGYNGVKGCEFPIFNA
ncbi:hypothetical protein [Flavihumibacter fluminis]|nr:hypothetical protein [Flavihumibacter fluminis]